MMAKLWPSRATTADVDALSSQAVEGLRADQRAAALALDTARAGLATAEAALTAAEADRRLGLGDDRAFTAARAGAQEARAAVQAAEQRVAELRGAEAAVEARAVVLREAARQQRAADLWRRYQAALTELDKALAAAVLANDTLAALDVTIDDEFPTVQGAGPEWYRPLHRYAPGAIHGRAWPGLAAKYRVWRTDLTEAEALSA